MYFKLLVMPGTTYQITPLTMDASLPFIKYFATRHVPRSCWGSRAEPQGGGLHRYHHRKVFFLSLSLFVREIEQGSPSTCSSIIITCNNTLHAPIRSHADNVARIKREKKGALWSGLCVLGIY